MHRVHIPTQEEVDALAAQMLEDISRYGDEADVATITTVKMVCKKNIHK